jgi:hypothetical protein
MPSLSPLSDNYIYLFFSVSTNTPYLPLSLLLSLSLSFPPKDHTYNVRQTTIQPEI